MIAEQIKRYRMECGLTQQQMATKLHFAQNTISNYENGKRTPRVDRLVRIAALLGVTVNDLTGSEKTPGATSGAGQAPARELREEGGKNGELATDEGC